MVERNDLNRRPLRLLLIEDHADLADLTAEFLGLAGMEVRIARCGTEALETVTAFQPQIVLCDLRLPDMSGLVVAQRLRASPNSKDALIAIHTGFGEHELGSLNQTAVDLLLPKPLIQKQIDQLLAHFESLQRSGLPEPPPGAG